MKILVGLSAASLLSLVAGCSSQMPAATPSASAAAAQSAPLKEPFRSAFARWNYYREAAGVPPVVADPALNEAAFHHAKYLVNNHIEAGDAMIENGRLVITGPNMSAHAESPGNPWYTDDGAKWADYSTVIRDSSPPTDGAPFVDQQVSRTDSLAVLDPQLAAVGFGNYCANNDCAGVIVYRRGLTKAEFLSLYEGNSMDWNPMLGTMPVTIARLRKPIEFPSRGLQAPSGEYPGGQYPNPLTSCHGYTVPAGVPIVLQLGAPSQGDDVKVSSSSLTEDGSQIDTCAFDATSYRNPDGFAQGAARRVLHQYGAVVVIPKEPLQPGHNYTVTVVADSQPYTWTFSIAPNAGQGLPVAHGIYNSHRTGAD